MLPWPLSCNVWCSERISFMFGTNYLFSQENFTCSNFAPVATAYNSKISTIPFTLHVVLTRLWGLQMMASSHLSSSWLSGCPAKYLDHLSNVETVIFNTLVDWQHYSWHWNEMSTIKTNSSSGMLQVKWFVLKYTWLVLYYDIGCQVSHYD